MELYDKDRVISSQQYYNDFIFDNNHWSKTRLQTLCCCTFLAIFFWFSKLLLSLATLRLYFYDVYPLTGSKKIQNLWKKLALAVSKCCSVWWAINSSSEAHGFTSSFWHVLSCTYTRNSATGPNKSLRYQIINATETQVIFRSGFLLYLNPFTILANSRLSLLKNTKFAAKLSFTEILQRFLIIAIV